MTFNSEMQAKPPLLKRLAIPLIVGGVAGMLSFPIGFLFTSDERFSGLQAAELAAGLVGLLYVFVSVGALIMALFPRLGDTFLPAEDAEELRDQRKLSGLAGTSMFCSGAALFLLALAAPIGPLSIGFVLASGGLFWLISAVTGIASHRASDEMQKEVTIEALAWGCIGSIQLIGGWAFLSHLALLPPMQPLAVLAALYVIGFVATLASGIRRGLVRAK